MGRSTGRQFPKVYLPEPKRSMNAGSDFNHQAATPKAEMKT